MSSIVSNDHLPLTDQQDVFIRARAPVRVSFGGGGSDVTHYFSTSSGAVINSAISLYSHCMLNVRSDEKIIIRSHDLGASLKANNLHDALQQEGPFSLILSI